MDGAVWLLRGARLLSFWACTSCHGASELPAEDEPRASVVTAGIRRLSGPEYDRAASALLGMDVTPSAAWPPDAPLNGFTRSRAQTIDALLASRLDDGARALAEVALDSGFADGLGCELERPGCKQQVLQQLGLRAFRRSLTADEARRYLGLFDAGGDERAGLGLVLRALLQSPGLLYSTELGDLAATGSSRLTDNELASVLSFAVSGLPPDRELLEVAGRGELQKGEAREAQALRLLGRSEARQHYHRFVEEWLGIAELSRVNKDLSVYPQFPALRAAMLAETRAMVDQVLIGEGGNVQALLAGGFSVVPQDLTELYGLGASPVNQRLDLSAQGRIGILQHASFLSVHAHESNSGPVLRGAAILRRLLCRSLPNPSELGIEVVPPVPDPSLTTRQRYAQHAADAACAGCHDSIDGVGFTFENFDGVGARRDVEAGQPVDTSGAIELQTRVAPLADSVDLARALAGEPELRDCLARQIFRYLTGLDAPEAEAAFIAQSASLPLEQRSSIIGLVLGYAKGPLIVDRIAP